LFLWFCRVCPTLFDLIFHFRVVFLISRLVQCLFDSG
jgi:hypothetical protein